MTAIVIVGIQSSCCTLSISTTSFHEWHSMCDYEPNAIMPGARIWSKNSPLLHRQVRSCSLGQSRKGGTNHKARKTGNSHKVEKVTQLVLRLYAVCSLNAACSESHLRHWLLKYLLLGFMGMSAIRSSCRSMTSSVCCMCCLALQTGNLLQMSVKHHMYCKEKCVEQQHGDGHMNMIQ